MTGADANVRSGLYIDVENLGNDSAGQLIDQLLGAWPKSAPKPTKINLYVKGDTTSLWRMRFSGESDGLEVSVKGIQHFSVQGSKNSADIAIAIDAIADFAQGKVSHISIFSDDSDFMSLFDKIIELTKDDAGVPFLWILTSRAGNKSSRIKGFIPEKHLHYVGTPKPDTASGNPATASKNTNQTPKSTNNPTVDDIAICIIRNVPVGKFKIAVCQKIIKQKFPSHNMANVDGAKFGSWFANDVWKVLQTKGVKLSKAKAPRTYEMTQAAKDSIG